MKTRILIAPLLGALLALVPGTAHAKGAQDATVTGPGLAQPLRFATHEAASELGQKAGLYEGLFESNHGAPAASAPPGVLGPRYVAEYRLAGPDDPVEVRQELYPFAAGGAVTYTAPDQRLFGDDERSIGGWFRAGAGLTDLLVWTGVPVPAGAVVSTPRLAG